MIIMYTISLKILLICKKKKKYYRINTSHFVSISISVNMLLISQKKVLLKYFQGLYFLVMFNEKQQRLKIIQKYTTDTISSFLCRQYTKIMNIYMSTIDVNKFVDLNTREMKTVDSNILYIGISY